MSNTQQSHKHSIYGPCIVSKRSSVRQESTVSTASIGWVVVSLLTLSQHRTSVCAFTQSHRTRTVPFAQTNYLKPNLQPPRRLSCLNYRNIENQSNRKDHVQQDHVEVFKLPWKDTVRGQMKDNQQVSSEIEQQFIVDKYLESIDRRYKRVHQGDTKDHRSQRGFTSAWAWLIADESFLIEEENQRTKDDALCVLGLAKLASVRLLQKHHLPITQSQQQSSKGKKSMITDARGEDSKMAFSIRAILATKPLARFLNRMQKAYANRFIIVSLQLRSRLYHMLRRSRSMFTQFLAALSLTSRYMISGRFVSQLALMVSCAIIIRLFKA